MSPRTEDMHGLPTSGNRVTGYTTPNFTNSNLPYPTRVSSVRTVTGGRRVGRQYVGLRTPAPRWHYTAVNVVIQEYGPTLVVTHWSDGVQGVATQCEV